MRAAPPAAIPEWLLGDMARIEDVLLTRAGASAHPLVAEPATHLIKAGGKRLRPALVLLTSRFGAPDASTDLAAAAVELVHLATLYHDDVMDETDVRRGVPTAHAKWGTEIAVLAGDYLFACGSSLGAAAGGEVPGILAQAIADVCEGQIVETAALHDPRRAVEDYLETISLKTGALFRAACELGASTSGVDADGRAALIAYGEHLGRAFQMVDDLLDLVGDPAVTGKELGTDLKEGVFTMAPLLASQRDESVAGLLESGERELDALLPGFRSTGALDDAMSAARDAARRAEASLEPFEDGREKEALHGILAGVLAQVP